MTKEEAMYQLTIYLRPLAIAFVAGSLVAATPALAEGKVKSREASNAAATGILWAAMSSNDSTHVAHEISHLSHRHGNAGHK